MSDDINPAELFWQEEIAKYKKSHPDWEESAIIPADPIPPYCFVQSKGGLTSLTYPVSLSIEDAKAKLPEATQVLTKDLPTESVFRLAWVLQDGKVSVDESKAKEIQLSRWRAARKQLFEELDAEWSKAFETKDDITLKAVEQKKQELRDVTDMDLSAVKLGDLADLWPECLPSQATVKPVPEPITK